MPNTKKRILVTGDLIIDKNIARLSSGRQSYRDPCPATLETTELGGAWYLAEIMRGVLPGACIIEPPQEDQGQAGQAMTLWEMKLAEKGGKEKCWRVSEFMGCHCPGDSKKARSNPFKDCGAVETVVLDDLGLAFAEEEGTWLSKESTSCFSGATAIIGKTTTLDKPLWRYLLKSDYAIKLTLVTTIDAIREVGGQVRRSLSWDSTIEDLKAEFSGGSVGAMLGRCNRVIVLFRSEGIGVFSREIRTPDDSVADDRLRLEQFVYDPVYLEGAWSKSFPGKTYGWLSWLTAAVTTSVVASDEYSRFVMYCRALGGIREFHYVGAGSKKDGPQEAKVMNAEIVKRLVESVKLRKEKTEPQKYYGVAFPRELLDENKQSDIELQTRTLLTDATGYSLSFIQAKAEEIVRRGPQVALNRVPCAKYGLYVTYDRDEIERINTLRNLITDYVNGKQSQPLCIAVFGQPGSGKSFAIKQLAKTLFPDSRSEITFNISQFESLSDLHAAFHQVRDMALQGHTPLVFWDEFDSSLNGQPLQWLKDFLAPMQDGEFSEHGKNHPIGRAIFIFAGGTAHSYAQFESENLTKKDKKAPDFISRLRGYVDIKGPNPNSETDHLYPIRRALLLRVFVQIYFGNALFDREGQLAIEPGVLRALLSVKEYLHGARSMEAAISYSHLKNAYRFGPSELPPRELLEIHLTEGEFLSCVQQGQRLHVPLSGFVQELMPRLHEIWRKAKVADGWTCGDKIKGKKTNPYLMPFNDLKDEGKERNRGPAELMLVKLEAVGLQVVPSNSEEAKEYNHVTSLNKDETKLLAIIEHQRWMRERLMEGLIYGTESSDELYTHCDICKYDSLDAKTQQLDKDQIKAVMEVLKKLNLVLVRIPKKTGN